MEQRIALLINIAAQKLVILGLKAYSLQLKGYPAKDIFCELTKLQSVIAVLQSGLELSLKDLEDLEEIVRNIGDRDNLPYRPVVVQPGLEVKPKDSCCDNSDIKDAIDGIWDHLNYEKPWLKLTPIGLAEDNYEVGFGLRVIDVNWNANKTPLDLILVDFPSDPTRGSANLIGTHTGITLDFRPAQELVLNIYGRYNDKQAYKGQHLLAEDTLCFKTKWPCYWGVGPMNALDDESLVNQFALSLTREICCKECVEADLAEGQVLYFFFPYKGKRKQFVTDNGVINNSFKGTVDGFKTQSLITNNLPGDMVYGVIRSDQPGIGPLKVCVREVEWPVYEVVAPEPIEDNIEYNGIWSGVICAKNEEIIEGLWTNAVCVKEGEPEVDPTIYGECYELRIDTTHPDYDPLIQIMVNNPESGIITKDYNLYPSYDDGTDYVVFVCSTELPLIYLGGVAVQPPLWITVINNAGQCLLDNSCLPPL